jgi:hypothetical protein
MAAFFCIWLLINALNHTDKFPDLTWQETLLFASLFWFVYFTLGVELLSLFKGLTRLSVALMWAGLLLGLLIAEWKLKYIAKGWQQLGRMISLPKRPFAIISLSVIVIILVILLITGIMSPPNIHDVLVYHMSRVVHWIQNQSVAHYPTTITYQLFHPPFAEYNLLNWTILSGDDYLSAFHQWYGLVLTLVIVGAIAKELGADKKGQWFSALFTITLPIIVLQTASAKNDVFLGFLVATLAYFVVKAAKRELSFLDWLGAAIAVGLGILTKGNYVFYALPLLIWLLVSVIKKGGLKRAVQFAVLGLVIVTILNGAFWIRNTQVFGSPMGNESSDLFMNKRFGLDVVVSNLSRNIVVQMVSGGFVNDILFSGVQGLHNVMGMELFDQETTLGPAEFYSVPTREEVVGNPIHFALTVFVVLGLVISLVRKKDRKADGAVLLLGALGFGGMLIFSSVFRWQVWGNRYFIPYYVIFAPTVGYVLSKRLGKWMVWLVSVGLIVWAINPLMNNYSKSFSWSESNRNSIWRMSRKGLLFANEQSYEGSILELTHAMDVSECREYGMVFYSNDPEYLIWAALTPERADYTLSGFAVDNPSAKLTSPTDDPCGIIVFGGPAPEELDDSAYVLAEEWVMDSEYQTPLFLYLLPEFQ